MSQGTTQVPVFPQNQFMLEEFPIGRGGYGTVFRGQHTKLGIVAIKTLIDTGLLPQKHLMTLKREAEKLRGVCQHPSILNLHGIISEKNNYSLVLEYMPLGSATEFRKDFTVQWPLIVQIIRDLVDGMTFLHEHNPTILHLDLKGDNILLDKLCRAKISDFGLSEWKTITMTVTRGGGGGQDSARKCTVTHVPPEVWSNVNLPSDKYYDIYSFGIVIWELLSGQFPYKMASEELIRSSVLSGQRPDFIQIPKDCPMFLTKLMTRCWHQKPTQRPHFKDIRPELNDEFEKNYRKHVVKSLKFVRREITRIYPSTDPVYVFTNEIDNMVEPVEPVEPVPSTSFTPPDSTSTKMVEESSSQRKQEEPKKEEPRAFPKSLFKKYEDLSSEDKEVRKVLFSPTACRILKTRHFTDIFKVTEETRQILINPVTRKQYIEADETLARQVKYSKCNAINELDGEYYDHRTSVGLQWAISSKRDYYESQRKSYYRDKSYGGYNQDTTLRGKKHKRAMESLEKNPAMKKLRNGGSFYKVKKILENPEVLKQALADREKGVSNALRLVAIDNESLDLLKNPFLLIMVFGSEYDIKRKYIDDEQYKGLYTELFANATYKSEFPSGGWKLPADMCDMVPRWLEEEMTKEGFDVDKMTQMKDNDRGRRRYHYGMLGDSDDDDYDDYPYYPSMRHMSRRMMDVRPGENLHKKFEGYNLRKMVGEIERENNRTDLAKKVMRILSRPPREEREKEKEKKKKDRKSMGVSEPSFPDMPPDLPMRGHPLEMMMMMGMDPSRMDDKALMRNIMRMEQKRMKDMRSAQRKAPKSPTSPSPSATVSKPDLETDAIGSLPKESKTAGEQGQADPSDPKKSKADDAQSTKEEKKPSVSTAKDDTVEVEHKHSGMLGGITKLIFGKNTKLPNMQVGDRNVMRIGGHNDDSDDDMLDSSHDKSYKPPSHEREPTKGELDKICSRIHGDYRNLGRQLKLPTNTIEQIIEDYRKEGMHEMTYQIIKKWQEMNGSEASNVVLSDALHKMRRDDLSKFLRF